MPTKYLNDRVLEIDMLIPTVEGDADLSGILGVTVRDSSGSALTITQVVFSVDGLKAKIAVAERILASESYTFAYDASVGDWREFLGTVKTEKISAPSFGTACGVDWQCSGGADSVTGNLPSGSAYFTETIPSVQLTSRELEITATANASDASGIGYIDAFSFGVPSGQTVVIDHTAPGTGDVFVYPSTGSITTWDFFSVKEKITTKGVKILSHAPIRLNTYLRDLLAHTLHFKLDERASDGVLIKDSQGNANITIAKPQTVSYPDPYGITFDGTGDETDYSNNKLEGYRSGFFVYYFDVIWNDLNNPIASSRKASLSHIPVGVSTPIDIQLDSGTVDKVRVSVSGVEDWEQPSTILADATNPAVQFKDGNGDCAFTGCVTVELGGALDTSMNIYTTDGTTTITQALLGKTDYLDLSNTQDSQFEPGEILQFTPAFRSSTSRIKGLYVFQDFRPTPTELTNFIQSLRNQIGAGDKTVYAPWIDKT